MTDIKSKKKKQQPTILNIVPVSLLRSILSIQLGAHSQCPRSVGSDSQQEQNTNVGVLLESL